MQALHAPINRTGARVRWEDAPVSRFEHLEAAWNALHAKAWPTPVLAFDFAAALVSGFARGDERILTGYAKGRPVALGVLTRRSGVAWETFQPSQAPVGLWVHDPAWDLEMLLRSLLGALPRLALLVGITQQDPLRAPRPCHSHSVSTLDYIQTGSVLVNRAFETYWSERDKKVRYEMKRRLTRLADQGLAPHLEKITDHRAVAGQIAAFGELESAGWKAQGGTAVHAANAQGAFYRDLMSRFCRRGAGRIYRYADGERVLAMQLCVEHEGTLAFLKTTYDERMRACAPGVLMKAEIFRDLFQDGGIRRIEFYGSLKEWQLKWVDAVRTQYHVNAYRAPLVCAAHRLAARLCGRRPARAAAGGATAQAQEA